MASTEPETKKMRTSLAPSNRESVFLAEKLKRAQEMLIDSKKQIVTLTDERNRAFKQLMTLPLIMRKFRQRFDKDMQTVQECQENILDEFRDWIKDLKKNVKEAAEDYSKEHTKVKTLMNDYENKIRDLKAQMECKKEQVKWQESENDVEIKKCDVLRRDLHLADVEVWDLKEKLDNKLFLGQYATCGQCKARERVKDAMAQQVVEKGLQNQHIAAELEIALKSGADKERIVQMLSKTNQRIQFELTVCKEDTEKKLEKAKKQWEKQWESQMAEALTSWEGRASISALKPKVEISPPTSDSSNDSSKIPTDVPSKESANPFSGWVGKSSKKKEETNTYLNQIAASVMAGSVKSSDKQSTDASEAESASTSTDAPKLNLPIPPPPVQPKTETMEDEINEEKETTLNEEVSTLKSQLDGFTNLSNWYRKELKGAIDQVYFYSERLETETDMLETQGEEFEKLTAQNEELQKEVESQKEEMEDLKQKVAQLVATVQSYFNQGQP